MRKQRIVDMNQLSIKNTAKMLNFLSESFGDSNKSHTFASAFENERNLKQNELRSEEESIKRKSSLKRFT